MSLLSSGLLIVCLRNKGISNTTLHLNLRRTFRCLQLKAYTRDDEKTELVLVPIQKKDPSKHSEVKDQKLIT